MKKAFAILFMFASVSVWAAPDLNQKITIKAKNVTVDKAFAEVTAHTNIKFVVNPNIAFKKKISIDVKEASLKDVLDFLVAEQNVAWTTGQGNSIEITTTK